MNRQRAREIAESPVMANVTYNDVPVYIQHVNEENDTARIFPLDEPQNEMTVPLYGLREQ